MKWITRERARSGPDRLSVAHHPVHRSQAGVPVRARARGSRGREPASRPSRTTSRTWSLAIEGARCSFDAFVARYELADPALAALAEIVRGADTDDRGLTPESAGLYAAATGFQATSRDDYENMSRQFPMYDALYESLPRADRRYAGSPSRGVRVPPRGGQERGGGRSVPATGRGPGPGGRRGGGRHLQPDAELAPGAVKGLAAEGLTAAPARPRPVTLYDLSSAARVVSFGCEIGMGRAGRWTNGRCPRSAMATPGHAIRSSPRSSAC